jgi:DNA processing protein
MDYEALKPWLALSWVPGLHGAQWRRLHEAFGAPDVVVQQPLSKLAQVVEPAMAEAIRHAPPESRWKDVVAWLQQPNRNVVTLQDPLYPALLREIADPPPILYAAGRRALLERPILGVVGSRNATAQGMRNAESFAQTLAAHGLCIASGLALGIDTAAHRGALRSRGSSIAVLGCGIDVIYPPPNAALHAQLAAEGLLLSEFPLGAAPLAHHFPRRNRIIAGLSRGCLVVEAAAASGSLITARLAVDMGRDVFAIPGSIHAPLSKGCHHLIKQGAKLVDDAADVLEELGIEVQRSRESTQKPVHDEQHARLLRALGYEACDFDTLATRTGFAADRLLAVLTQLELDARVVRTDSGAYQRLD